MIFISFYKLSPVVQCPLVATASPGTKTLAFMFETYGANKNCAAEDAVSRHHFISALERKSYIVIRVWHVTPPHAVQVVMLYF
jgi:hypothetical protein